MTWQIGSLFTGYAGLDLAVEQFFGARTVWCSDIDPGACKIIAHRMPGVPNLGDITKVDWAEVEPVDILTGGFPCQDVSHAGKRAGMRPDTRSGLWTHMAYAIEQLRPRYVIAENVRGLLSARADSDVEPCPWCVGGAADGEPDLRALGAVLGDLAGLGYDARWVGLRAADVGAPHGRFRVFIVGDADRSTGSERRFAAPRQAEAGRSRPDAGGSGRASAADAERGGRERGRADGQRGAPDATAGRGAESTPDAGEQGSQGGEPAARRHLPDGGAAADTEGDGREQGRPEPARLVGGPDAAQRGDAAADAGGQLHGRGQDSRSLGRLDRDPEGEAPQRERARAEPGDRGASAAADTGSGGRKGGGGPQGREPDSDRDVRAGSGGITSWGVYEPAIRRWERVLRRPAPPPTETSARGSQRLSPRFVEWMQGLPDGWVCDVPDLGRNAQLKALGNGVVPQQAYAALNLMTRQAVAA